MVDMLHVVTPCRSRGQTLRTEYAIRHYSARHATVPSVSAFMWLALVESDRKYRSCPELNYAFTLEDTDVVKYNSNGFIAGIINSIGATTDAPLESFHLGDVPVPSRHFEVYCEAED